MREIATLSLGGSESRILLLEDGDTLPPADLFVADTNTHKLSKTPHAAPVVVVPPGESCKSMAVITQALEECTRAGLRRDSVITGIGGGAVTDFTAFLASLYLRGVPVTLVPTTLLAMVDAAIGGKTGVDFLGYKNMVGSFYPAQEVLIMPALLETLPDREFRSGLAEVIKAGMLGDEHLFSILEEQSAKVLNKDSEIIREVIERAIRVKCEVVAEDFRESGRRAFLNLGHTFGHALEASLGFGVWTHGEAVAWGIARALEAGVALGITDAPWHTRVLALLQRYNYPVEQFPASREEITAAMYQDKKRRAQGIPFVLQRGPQDTLLQPLPQDVLDSVLTPR